MAERSLKLETIQRALEEPARLEANSAVVAVHARGDWSKGPSAKEYVSLPETVSVGLNACKAWGQGPRTEEDWRVIKDWSNGDDLHKAAALYAYGPKKAPIDLIREGLKSHSDVLLPAGLYAAQGKSFEKELVLEALMSRAGSRFELKDLGDLPERMQISGSDIRKWLNSSCEYERYLAVRASINRSVPVGWLFDVAENEQYPDIRDAVVNVLRRWNVTARALKTYWNWYCSQQKRNVSLFILGICAGRDDVKSIIREGVESWFGNAPEACRGVNFSLAEINKWRNSVSSSERAAAMYASIGRPDVPDEWIAESLNDGVCFVEYAARLAREGRNFPPIRSFEPPEKVYKRCVGDVVVAAKIPADAEIRGGFSGKARANKALIVDVEGDFYGEKVGVSKYDKETLYRVGDEVFISDFDPGDNECSTGFHFYPRRP